MRNHLNGIKKWLKRTELNAYELRERQKLEKFVVENLFATRQHWTRRDQPKSAPYLRLKIAKGLQNVKVLVNWGPFYENFEKVSQCRKNWKGGPFGIFQHPFCRKTQKNEGGPFGRKILSKKSRTTPEKNSPDNVTRKKAKTFLVQFPVPTGAI